MATLESDDFKVASVAAALPTERAALLGLVAQAAEDLHASALASNAEGVHTARELYFAIVWKLNGGSFFGCMDSSNPEAGGILVKDHCKVAPGIVPTWGQCGKFLIAAEGMRAIVEFDDGFSRFTSHFSFQAVDAHAPFISETGYRSHFENMRLGCTVDEAAQHIFADYVQKRRKLIAPEYRDRLAAQAALAWLADLPSAAASVFQDRQGQMAFGF